jgi:ribose transport system permease protein
MIRGLTWLKNQPWIWSFAGAFLVWLFIVSIHGRGAGATLTMTVDFSVFFVIVGIGQMFVITLGPGNIDLSIPSTMALGGAVAMKVMNDMGSNIPVALLYTVLIGVAIGIFNFGLIRFLSIPPIIATLASNLIIMSAAISYGRGLMIKPPEIFSNFTMAKVFDLPIMVLVVIVFAILMGIVLSRTTYGRSVTAIGQNARAAWLAGINVARAQFITYTMSAVLAALAGALLSGFSGGSSLDLGGEYLLNSIAVVVLGGTSILGGNSNIPGIWGASMFLCLLVAMMNTLGVSVGLRLVLTGACIISVIIIGSSIEKGH